MKFLIWLVVVFHLVIRSKEAPSITDNNVVRSYLAQYGYVEKMNSEISSLMSRGTVQDAIKQFQAFAGLNQTGILDRNTLDKMNSPRCGNKDILKESNTSRRRKRYTTQGTQWTSNELTYKITKYPQKLTKKQVDRDIQRAFDMWSQVTELTFRPRSARPVHIEIRFERGEHGDKDPFDGPMGTLAHAYFPQAGGDVHFDEEEIWTVDSPKGTNLFQVAAHEFGHSLGLKHSEVQTSLMTPLYQGYMPNFVLDDDDIKGIQHLYRKKLSPYTPVTSGDPRLCADWSIDAITTLPNKITYVFKGQYFWELTKDGIAQGSPRPVVSVFRDLPSDLDAAFTWTNGHTYFFKGDKFWKSTGFEMVTAGYPKMIDKGFPGIPDDIDGAFVWSGNGQIYFFKGSMYYKYDTRVRPGVSQDYPKPVRDWEGIPSSIDDALQYSNGHTYFFKRGKYWRVDNRSLKVSTADPPYPRPVGPWWFGCPQV